MKKNLILALFAVTIVSVITSCNNHNNPSNPDDEGEACFVAEIYEITTKSPEKAVSDLVKKGYNISYEFVETGYGIYALDYDDSNGEYTIQIITDGVNTNQVNGFYDYRNLNDYQDWSKWLNKKISSYTYWQAIIDNDEYFDYKGLSADDLPSKSDYEKALSKYKLTDDGYLNESFVTEDLSLYITLDSEGMGCLVYIMDELQ